MIVVPPRSYRYPYRILFQDVAKRTSTVCEKKTGIEPEMESTMDEIRLASFGISMIV